jgi:hypothetical protein
VNTTIRHKASDWMSTPTNPGDGTMLSETILDNLGYGLYITGSFLVSGKIALKECDR